MQKYPQENTVIAGMAEPTPEPHLNRFQYRFEKEVAELKCIKENIQAILLKIYDARTPEICQGDNSPRQDNPNFVDHINVTLNILTEIRQDLSSINNQLNNIIG